MRRGRTHCPPHIEADTDFPLSPLCPEGYVCNAGTNSSTEKDQPCPAGYYCNFGTTNATQFDNLCAAGFFCPRGSTNTTADENVCPAGYFCPAGTPDSPLFIPADKCPLGTTSDPGATTALSCYKTCRFGDVNSCVVVAQANALGNGSLLTVAATGYAVVTFDFTAVYRQPTAAALEYNDHFRVSVYWQGARQNMSFYFDHLAGQPALVEMAVFAMVDLQLSVQIDILHGYYIQAAALFVGVANSSVYYPNRADYGVREQVFALLAEKDVDALNLQLPLNIVANDQVSVLLDDANANSSFASVMDDEADLLQTASYWRLATYAQKATGIVTFPFLPFFSSCLGYDGHIPLGFIFEQPDGCSLVDPSDTVPISNFGISVSPVADTCDVSVQCTYEEAMALSSVTRWFELPTASTMFYLTQQPWSADDFTSPSAAQFLALVGTQGAIPVSVLSDLVYNTTQMQIPQTVTLDIGFYQVSPTLKQIVTASVNLSNVVLIPSDYDPTTDGANSSAASNSTRLNRYTLVIRYHPLLWLDLLNSFTLSTQVYAVVFLLIGFAAVVIMITFWLANRLCSKRRNLARFRFWTFAQIIIPPPLLGGALAVLCVLSGVAMILLLWKFMYPVAWQQTTGNYSDILALTSDRIEFYRIGRLGSALLFLGLMLTWVGACLFVPSRDVVGKASDMWQPVLWKRTHMVTVSVGMAAFLSIVLQVSYSPFFAANIYACTVAFKALQVFIDVGIMYIMGEWLTSSPLMVSLIVMQYIVSMGAAIFEEFLLSFFILFMVLIVERVYIDPRFKTFVHRLPIRVASAQLRLYQRAGYTQKALQAQERVVALTEEMGTQTIEPMLNSLVLYANETTALLMNPFIVLFILGFATETQIPTAYSINAQDLQYYLLFCLLIIVPQFCLDCFLMNTIEIHHGYPLFDYIEFARYRFKTRQKRWKSDEPNVDETLHPRHQSIDQLCFSSQFYFCTALHNWGILLMVMGTTVMYNQQYNMFGDALMPLTFLFFLFSTLVGARLADALAHKTRLWEKDHDADSALVRRRLRDKQEQAGMAAAAAKKRAHGEDPDGASTLRTGRETQRTERKTRRRRRSELTAMLGTHSHFDVKNEKQGWYRSVPVPIMTGAEMREKFVDLNRQWILRHLPQVVDAQAVERHRDYLTRQVEEAVQDRRAKHRRLVEQRDAAMRQASKAARRRRRYPRPSPPQLRFVQSVTYDPSPAVRRIAQRWVMRARHVLWMCAAVQDIRLSERCPSCAQCGGCEELEVEEFVPARTLLAQFDALCGAVCGGWAAPMRAAYVDANWRLFYHQSQHFRTRCWRCRVSDMQQRMAPPQPVDVSDDEEEAEGGGVSSRAPLLPFTVPPLVLRFVDKLRRRAQQRRAHMHAPLHPLAPVRLRRAPPPPHGPALVVSEDSDDSDTSDDAGADALRRPHAVLRDGPDGRTHLPPLVGGEGGDRRPRGVRLSQGAVVVVDAATHYSGDRFHFTAQPTSARRDDISDDSDDEGGGGGGQGLPGLPVPPVPRSRQPSLLSHASAPPAPRGDISDDSDQEAGGEVGPRRVQGAHKHQRMYSDFGQHRHEGVVGVGLFGDALSPLGRAEVSSDSSEEEGEGVGELPGQPRVEMKGEGKEEASEGTRSPSQPASYTIFGGRRAMSDASSDSDRDSRLGGGRGGRRGGGSVGSRGRGDNTARRGGARGRGLRGGGSSRGSSGSSTPSHPSLLRAQRVYAVQQAKQKGVKRTITPDPIDSMDEPDDPDWWR